MGPRRAGRVIPTPVLELAVGGLLPHPYPHEGKFPELGAPSGAVPAGIPAYSGNFLHP